MVTMIGDSSHQGRKPDAVSMAVRWGGTFLWGLLLTLHLGITPNGVLAQEIVRPRRLIIIPSMTVTGDYDTNIFQDPFDEVEDYSTIYSPGPVLAEGSLSGAPVGGSKPSAWSASFGTPVAL